MKQMLLIFALMVSPAAGHDFSTVDEFQSDFKEARECQPVDGRRLWVGQEGYYVQAWLFQTGQSGLLDDENAAVVPFNDNDPASLVTYKAACQ